MKTVSASASASVSVSAPVSASVSAPASVSVSAPVSAPASVSVSAPVSAPASVSVSVSVSASVSVSVSASVSASASAPASALAAALAAVLAAGCAAPQTPTESLIATGQRVAACQRFTTVGEASETRDARAHARLLAQQYRISVTLSVQTLDATNQALGRPLLHGDITALSITASREGPQLDRAKIDVAAREDGARWESIVKVSTLHDTLRSLFGARGDKLPPDAQRTTRHGGGASDTVDPTWRLARANLEGQSEACHYDSPNPCTQLVPLARAAPSVGPDELLFNVAFYIKDATDSCRFEQTYAIPLPPGASLTERLSALAARGPLVLGHTNATADAPPPIQ